MITDMTLVAFTYYLKYNGDVEKAEEAIKESNGQVDEAVYNMYYDKFKKESVYNYYSYLSDTVRMSHASYPGLPRIVFHMNINVGTMQDFLDKEYRLCIFGSRGPEVEHFLGIDEISEGPRANPTLYYDPITYWACERGIYDFGQVPFPSEFAGKKPPFPSCLVTSLGRVSKNMLVMRSSGGCEVQAVDFKTSMRGIHGSSSRIGVVPSSFNSDSVINNIWIENNIGVLINTKEDLLKLIHGEPDQYTVWNDKEWDLFQAVNPEIIEFDYILEGQISKKEKSIDNCFYKFMNAQRKKKGRIESPEDSLMI